jgi:hypothetical protein
MHMCVDDAWGDELAPGIDATLIAGELRDFGPGAECVFVYLPPAGAPAEDRGVQPRWRKKGPS